MPMPVTARSNGDKMYGSAILTTGSTSRYGEEVVRQAWALSVANTVAGGSLRPRRLRRGDPPETAPASTPSCGNFAASTAVWHAANSGVHEGARSPTSSASTSCSPPTARCVSGKLDHTGYAVFDVAATNAPSSGSPAGSRPASRARSRSSARRATTSGRRSARCPTGGRTSVTIDNPGQYDKVSAVVVNGSAANTAGTARTGRGATTRRRSRSPRPRERRRPRRSGRPGNPGRPRRPRRTPAIPGTAAASPAAVAAARAAA